MKLKKGMSFEVVESLVNECDVRKGGFYCRDIEDGSVFDDENDWFCLFEEEVKIIGRLIIKEVK